MPTGYTAIIEDGCTFEQFVWRCARGMGACVMMRDDPMDTPVPDEFQPSTYHREEIERLQNKLERLEWMTIPQVKAEIQAERESVIAANARYATEHKEKSARYETILEKVRAWNPPSSDHVGLKELMMEQIEISLPGELYQQPPPCSDPQEWLSAKLSKARNDLAYHREHHSKELARTKERNEWVKGLRQSVPQP